MDYQQDILEPNPKKMFTKQSVNYSKSIYNKNDRTL